MVLTAGQVSDYIRAKLIHPKLPEAKVTIADKGYDSDEYRIALQAKVLRMHKYSKTLYKQRHKVENMFGRL